MLLLSARGAGRAGIAAAACWRSPSARRRGLSGATVLGRDCVELCWGARAGRLESGRLAPLADGAVVGWDAETVVLATACAERDAGAREGGLQVEFRAKSAAAGQIPQHILRRELGPREGDVVVARLVQRALRAQLDTAGAGAQVICTTLAFGRGDAPALCINAASAALGLAAHRVPFRGPVGCVRVGARHSRPAAGGLGPLELFLFPERFGTLECHRDDVVFDLLVAGSREGLVLVELTCAEPVPRALVCEAVTMAAGALPAVLQAQADLVAAVAAGRRERGEPEPWRGSRAAAAAAAPTSRAAAPAPAPSPAPAPAPVPTPVPGVSPDDIESRAALAALANEVPKEEAQDGVHADNVERLLSLGAAMIAPEAAGATADRPGASPLDVELAEGLSGAEDDANEPGGERAAQAQAPGPRPDSAARGAGLAPRPDGRSAEQLRPVRAFVGVLPVVHGSASFSQGRTNVLASATLGRLRDVQRVVPYCGEIKSKALMVQVDLPPYGAGATGYVGLSREMISQGELLERALRAVMPGTQKLPFAVRATSEVTAAEGAVATAALCAASLALMAAGVPLRGAVAGVTVGVSEHGIAVDLGAAEEPLMSELRVAGCSQDDLTAVQLEARAPLSAASVCRGIDAASRALPGLVAELVAAAAVRPGRAPIVEEVVSEQELLATDGDGCKEEPRGDEEDPTEPLFLGQGPRTLRLALSEGQMSRVVGPGGQTIRQLQLDLGVSVDTLAEGASSQVLVYARDGGTLLRARQRLAELLDMPKIGTVLEGCEVLRIKPTVGCNVLLPKPFETLDAFLPIAEVAITRLDRIDAVLKVGDRLSLKCIAFDAGYMRMSRRQVVSHLGKLPPPTTTAGKHAAAAALAPAPAVPPRTARGLAPPRRASER